MEAVTRVFWDGLGIGSHDSGVGRHGASLLSALAKDGLVPEILKAPPILAKLKILAPQWAGIEAGRRLQKGEAAVLHGLSNMNLPLHRRSKLATVLTVHDVIPLLYPRSVSMSLRLQMRAYLVKACAVADQIICVSAWTRATLEEFIPESFWPKIIVIPNGFPTIEAKIPKTESGAPVKALIVSRAEPYKRLNFLLPMLDAAAGSVELTVVTNAHGLKKLQAAGAKMLGKGCLKLRQGVSDLELAAIYRSSDIYLQPSIVEGYGLPVAEALALGLPVVYVGGSGTDEVVPPALGMPLSAVAQPDEWLAAMRTMIVRAQGSSFEQERQEALKKRMTWADVGKRVLGVYEAISS